jgi:hypothetical protein
MAVATLLGTGRMTISIASLDQDWDYATDFADYTKGIRVHSIEFVPSDWTTDICQIKDGGATGPVVFNSASANRYHIKYFHGAWLKPYYDISDTNKCVASANAKIIIHLGGFSL